MLNDNPMKNYMSELKNYERHNRNMEKYDVRLKRASRLTNKVLYTYLLLF